jgi:hypothetical protein
MRGSHMTVPPALGTAYHTQLVLVNIQLVKHPVDHILKVEHLARTHMKRQTLGIPLPSDTVTDCQVPVICEPSALANR